MNEAIADGYKTWLNAEWQGRCPAQGPDGRRCHAILDEFTTHTSLCDDHGCVDKNDAIAWALCELPS